MYGPRTAGFDLPIVRGLGGVEDGRAPRPRAARAARCSRDLGELGGRDLRGLRRADAATCEVVLRGGARCCGSATPPYRQRFVTFLGLRRELPQRCPDAEYFDLRFRDRIYVKPSAVPTPSEPGASPSRPAAESEGRRTRRVARPGGRAPIAMTALTEVVLAKKKDRYIVGLDIGTHKVCAIVAEITEEGRLDVIGIGQTESQGAAQGRRDQPRRDRRLDQERGRGGGADGGGRDRLRLRRHRGHPHPRLQLARRGRGLEQEPRRSTARTCAASIDAAKAVSIPLDREILHVLPQEFVVDDQDGIGDPTRHDGHPPRGERPRDHLLDRPPPRTPSPA